MEHDERYRSLDLQDLNDWVDRDFYYLLKTQARFRALWRQQEWTSISYLFDHSVGKFWGKSRYDEDGNQRVRILDLGFGPATSIEQFTEKYNVPESDITALEISPVWIEKARGKWPDVEYVQTGKTVEDLLTWLKTAKQDGREWDLVWARHVLHRLPFPREVVGALSDLLTLGGLFIMAVPKAGGGGIDGEALLTDMKIRFEDEGVRAQLQAAQNARMDVIDLALEPFRSRKYRERKGWLPLLRETGLQVLNCGLHQHNAIYRKREQFAICEKGGL